MTCFAEMSMKLYPIISEAFNVPADNLNDEVVITSLEEWDSMAHMFFITKIEEGFGVNLTGDEIAAMQSVKDIKRILTEKGIKEQ